MASCPRCGQENRAQAKFCDACGAPVAAASMMREERKVVSVLFADLVGFTAQAERLDPEDVRALQDPYWQYVRSEIERHGGTVEKFIGDAVVALFGAPTTHEDDPERAVRGALAIRDWAREQEEIQVRIGVTTGEALVRLGAQPLAGEGMASGDVVNTASRLQAAAPTNAILVDETTRRATSDMIDCVEAEPVSAKGKPEPIRVWEALQARSRFGVDLFQHARTLLVGRERELDVLKNALRRVREEYSPQLVTLVGVPGMGKSRLVYELMQATANDPSGIVNWRQGRSLPYGDGVAFWALGEIIKAQAGILETDPEGAARAKLERAVQAVIDDVPEAEWVERHLRPLAGIGRESGASSERGEGFAAWRRFFEALADTRPTVLVVEDLHWADEGLLDFVDSLIEWVRDVPLLVVATARPELLERRPSWSGGKANATTLSLSPLSAGETALLVGQLVDRSRLTRETEQALVAHAAGNALYAEQYAQMWQERGHVEHLPVPETVQGIIAARLDALSSTEKSLLQDAAVFGNVFWDGAVTAVGGIDRQEGAASLHALERKEFVQRARRSSVAGEGEYAFCHVLVRDVAYAQIPRVARATKHEKAAEWTESIARPDDQAEMRAHHYLAALALGSAAGHTNDRLATRALPSVAQAGDRALALNAFAAAAGYYERALEFLAEEDQRPRLLFRHAQAVFANGSGTRGAALERARDALLAAGDVDGAAEAEALLGQVWWQRGQRDRAWKHFDHAIALVADRPTSPAKARVLSNAAGSRMVAHENERAIELSREAIALAEALRLPDVQAHSLITLGTARCNANDAGGRRDIKRGLELALETNNLRAAARGYNNLASTTEDVRRAAELQSASADIHRRLGDAEGLRFAHVIVALYFLGGGQWDDALRLANAFIAECEAGNPHYGESWARVVRAAIALARGETEAVLDDVRKALAVARQAKDPQNLFDSLAFAARAYTELGRPDEAQEVVDELLRAIAKFLQTDEKAAIPSRAFAQFLLVAGNFGLADSLAHFLREVPPETRGEAAALAFLEGRITDAARILDELGATALAADVRLRGSDRLLSQDRSPEATEQLEQALTFYRSVSATRYIGEAEALLAASRSETAASVPQPRA
jgi:predicted ATPase/class 3 adenylate cyclase